MAEHIVSRTRFGWTVQNSVLSLEADSPHIDRGAIRATLTVRRDDEILYRNTANLTSERARLKVIQTLSLKGYELDDRLIIALDEACRTHPQRAQENVRDGGTDISDTVPRLSLAELDKAFGARLLIHDRALLPVLAGAVLAHRHGGESVWLMIVAPPGGTKSEILRSLYGSSGMYPLSDLTARTFASGLDVPGSEPSLLARLNDEILVLKDFTTVLEMYREERQAILAQLREIYDGRFDKAWGTGRELHWEGRLGFVAGVTPIIDRHQAAMSVLGERFVLSRTTMPNRKKLAMAALKSAGAEVAMREELTAAMRGFLYSRATESPTTSDDVLDTLATVADFVTRARSGVIRDGYRRELEYAPEPEAPTRFAKVLHSLGTGIALAYDEPDVGERELALVLRVALDCLPVVRRKVIGALVGKTIVQGDDDTSSTSTLAGMAQFSTQTIRRTLEDLQALGIVTGHKQGQGKADTWQLNSDWVDVFTGLRDALVTTFPEMSEGVSHTKICDGCGDSFTTDDATIGYCGACEEARVAL